jgi:iron(III) transport system permease protein
MMARAATASAAERPLRPVAGILAVAGIAFLVAIAVAPHLGVVLTSVAERWYRTPLPTEWTLGYFREAVNHDLALPSIRNSLLFSSASTLVDLGMGVAIAYLVVRRVFPGRNLLDTLAMLPLALPGLVLAFGYYFTFGGPFLSAEFSFGQFIRNPLVLLKNPAFLLVVSYSIRRLPYMVRAAVAGLQQTSVTLEEAATNLGAGAVATLRRITLPLVAANLIAGGILAFSFAMLEVSDSLILTSGTKAAYPLTRAIYQLANRLMDGPMMACAMGVVGMAILALSLAAASRLIGRKMGQLFRA